MAYAKSMQERALDETNKALRSKVTIQTKFTSLIQTIYSFQLEEMAINVTKRVNNLNHLSR